MQRRPCDKYSIPPLRTNIEITRTYRFRAAAATAQAVSAFDLLLAGGSVCTVVDTTMRSIFTSVKVHRVSMWAAPLSNVTTGGGAATVSILWNNAVTGSDIEDTDTSVTNALPAYISARPPADSNAAFWQNTDVALFTVEGPINTIVDVHMSLVVADGETGGAGVTISTDSFALGVVGYGFLGSNDNYSPVGLTSFT